MDFWRGINFANPTWFAALAFLPLIWWMRRRRRPVAVRYARVDILGKGPSSGKFLRRLRAVLRVLAIVAATIALVRPQSGARADSARGEGIDIMLVLDISSSMLAEDFQPDNRLAVAKEELKKFVSGRRDDRIGLVAFAGEALTQVPLTVDYPVLVQAVDNLEAGTGQLEDGTAIGTAIATGANRLRVAGNSRVMVLLTDGENNRGAIDPRTAAQAAGVFNVRIYTIGVGSEGTAPMPVSRGVFGLRYENRPVRIDETLLEDIARSTNGRYFRAPGIRRRSSAFTNRSISSTITESCRAVSAVCRRIPVASWHRTRRVGARAAVARVAEPAALSYAVDYPWALAGALGLGIVAVLVVWLEFVRRRARLAKLGPVTTLERLVPSDIVHARLGRRPVWLGLAAVLAGISFAGPRWGTPSGDAETEGIDVVYAIDASLSMLAQDESPNRLERAKHEARRLRALSRGDRVALIAFAGRSYILTPLTSDDGALALFMDNLDPSIVGQAGSSLSAAITQGIGLLGPAVGTDRAIVLFTDAEALEEKALVLAASKRAAAAGVALVIVGFGTDDGGPIPVPVGSADQVAPKRDVDGRVVITHYDGAMAQAAADAAGGTVIGPGTTDKASRVRAVLMGLRAERRRVNTQRAIPSRYQWFLAPAIAILLWDLVAVRRRARATVVAALLAAVVPGVAGAQKKPLQDAERQFNAKLPLPAARAWRRALEAGDRSPQTLYNLGTAYLAADSLDSAIEVLERAATIPSNKMRSDVLFNLGLAYLKRGTALKGEPAAASLKSALRSYRSVLLANPGDADARWNYELAKKKEESAQRTSGGGGGNNNNDNPQGGGLPKDQASQLLDAAARDERDVRDKHQRAEQVKPVRGKDW